MLLHSLWYILDLRHKVRGARDENIPIINHTVIEARGLSSDFLNSGARLKKACDLFCEDISVSIVERRVHNFTPIGKTVFYVLIARVQESRHASSTSSG